MYKELYGEVPTPPLLVDRIVSMIPESVLGNANATYIEAGAGDGRISHRLVDKVIEMDHGQRDNIYDRLYMAELQMRHHDAIRKKLGPRVSIQSDFLSVQGEFDVVFGNPPYNTGGSIKVPTNKLLNKRNDGTAIWKTFVRHGLSILKLGGYLVFLIPSIWLKPDKAGIYLLMTAHAIRKLVGFSASETHKLFAGQAQTPLTLVCLQKTTPQGNILIYDTLGSTYIPLQASGPTTHTTQTP